MFITENQNKILRKYPKSIQWHLKSGYGCDKLESLQVSRCLLFCFVFVCFVLVTKDSPSMVVNHLLIKILDSFLHITYAMLKIMFTVGFGLF